MVLTPHGAQRFADRPKHCAALRQCDYVIRLCVTHSNWAATFYLSQINETSTSTPDKENVDCRHN